MNNHESAAEIPQPAPPASHCPGRPRHTRLITCQGTAQLVTAIAAAACKEERAGRDWRAGDNILVIHDLYSPAADQFDRVIRQMAAPLAAWKSIVTIPAERLRGFKSLASWRGADAAIRGVRELVGIDRADSIYLCRNWQFGSELLLNAYRTAEKICYGDGIGLYSARKHAPPGTRWRPGRGWKRMAQQAFASLLWGADRPALEPVEFDVGYLSGVEAFGVNGHPPMPTHVVNPSWQRRVIDSLCGTDFPGLSSLRESIRGRSCLVLIGESLSESGVVTPAAEIALYRDIVRRLAPPPGALLLYKPHPRDNPQKVKQIAASLAASVVKEVLTLDQGATAFLPFELLYASLFRSHSECESARIWTGGYTAMALEHLFGVSVNYGIGEELIRRHFSPAHIVQRIELERYMWQYLTQARTSPPVAA